MSIPAFTEPTTPRHTHDCDKCVFVGSFYRGTPDPKQDDTDGFVDLYVHDDEETLGTTTFIVRYSNHGPDYTSSINPTGNPFLALAYTRWTLLHN